LGYYIDKEETEMQNNSQGRRDRLDPKDVPAHGEPNSKELCSEAHPIEETASAEVTKSFTTGVVTDCLKLNVRKKPSADAEVLVTIDALSKVMVDMAESTNDFFKVVTETGIEGFCMRKYIALKK
jgi:hypothetical protein